MAFIRFCSGNFIPSMGGFITPTVYFHQAKPRKSNKVDTTQQIVDKNEALRKRIRELEEKVQNIPTSEHGSCSKSKVHKKEKVLENVVKEKKGIATSVPSISLTSKKKVVEEEKVIATRPSISKNELKASRPMKKEVKVTSEPSNLPIQLKYILRYAERDHWSLLVINPYDDVGLDDFLISEESERDQKNNILENGKGTVECGYYVMRYIREIIDTRNSYSQLELDEDMFSSQVPSIDNVTMVTDVLLLQETGVLLTHKNIGENEKYVGKGCADVFHGIGTNVGRTESGEAFPTPYQHPRLSAKLILPKPLILMPFLHNITLKEQYAIVDGCSIMDNIIISHKCLHFLTTKQKCKSNIATAKNDIRSTSGKRKTHCTYWKKNCLPKEEGGFNFQDLETFNHTLITKQLLINSIVSLSSLLQSSSEFRSINCQLPFYQSQTLSSLNCLPLSIGLFLIPVSPCRSSALSAVVGDRLLLVNVGLSLVGLLLGWLNM
uniref:Uncharacterized protein n=1 Tax=Cucumis melo TaxID=3656 RepID=A0A9I9EIU5_CUCME